MEQDKEKKEDISGFIVNIAEVHSTKHEFSGLKEKEIIRVAEENYEKIKNMWPVNKKSYIEYVIREFRNKAESMTPEEFESYIQRQNEFSIGKLKEMQKRMMDLMNRYKFLPFYKKIIIKFQSWRNKRKLKKGLNKDL